MLNCFDTAVPIHQYLFCMLPHLNERWLVRVSSGFLCGQPASPAYYYNSRGTEALVCNLAWPINLRKSSLMKNKRQNCCWTIEDNCYYTTEEHMKTTAKNCLWKLGDCELWQLTLLNVPFNDFWLAKFSWMDTTVRLKIVQNVWFPLPQGSPGSKGSPGEPGQAGSDVSK